MRTDELDFDLPSELIAQTPAKQRAASRLLHYKSADRSIAHRRFSDLPELLRGDDLLVFNDTRVIPARFTLKKSSGGRVDGLYLGLTESGEWRVMLKNLGPLKSATPSPGTPGEGRGEGLQSEISNLRSQIENAPHPNPLPEYRERGQELSIVGADDIRATVVAKESDGTYRMRVDSTVPALELLERIGRMPLPPYIKRDKDHDERDTEDRERYQTVYATTTGSVAAPTAGLHFTDELLRELDDRQIQRVHVTLHVGLGTFKPVTADSLEAHEMHAESYSIDARAADILNHAKREGRRIIAIGTTAGRVLESQPVDEKFQARFGETRIFIFPPYQWRHVNGLITNFHLPCSTLIALVAAKVGLDEQRRIYREAIEQRYRFFSYGDASFLE
jgi:S-adenosylmethionine:tRNA ribosyltransferase-isomerase